MNDNSNNKVHWSFWAISVFMLIWNVMGSANFFWQINATAEALAAFPETHRAIIEGRPIWATAGFGIGVIIGSLGCLLLLFRKSTALYFFIASLLGIIVTMIHTINVSITTIKFNPFEIIMMIVLPLVVATFLIWYTKKAEKKGWLV